MPNTLPDHLALCAIKEDDFERAYTNSSTKDRARVKYCLAILHRLYPEEPSTHASTKKWSEAGLQIEQTRKAVDWTIIHCPPTTQLTHLAAAVMITRLADVKTCFLVFDSPPKADLLMALEICGQLAEQTLCLSDAQSCEFIQHMKQDNQGRLVLLGDTPKALSEAALAQAIPILHATMPENVKVNPLQSHFADHFDDHFHPEDDEHCIYLDPNLTPSLFIEQTLLVTQLPPIK